MRGNEAIIKEWRDFMKLSACRRNSPLQRVHNITYATMRMYCICNAVSRKGAAVEPEDEVKGRGGGGRWQMAV